MGTKGHMSDSTPTETRARLDAAVDRLIEAEARYARTLANFNEAGKVRRRMGSLLNETNAAIERERANVTTIAKELALLK